jgi:hypothetical protein
MFLEFKIFNFIRKNSVFNPSEFKLKNSTPSLSNYKKFNAFIF